VLQDYCDSIAAGVCGVRVVDRGIVSRRRRGLVGGLGYINIRSRYQVGVSVMGRPSLAVARRKVVGG